MKRPGWKSKLGDWFAEHGKPKTAMRFFKSEARNQPNYYALFAYAHLLHLKKQRQKTTSPESLQEVIGYYESSLSMNPNFPDAYLEVGTVYRQQALMLANQDRGSAQSQKRLMGIIGKSRESLNTAARIDKTLREKVEDQLSELRQLEIVIRPVGLSRQDSN